MFYGVCLFKYNLIDSHFTTKVEIEVKPRQQALAPAPGIWSQDVTDWTGNKVEKNWWQNDIENKEEGEKESKTDAKARLSFRAAVSSALMSDRSDGL